jgi:hypothetical protein
MQHMQSRCTASRSKGCADCTQLATAAVVYIVLWYWYRNHVPPVLRLFSPADLLYAALFLCCTCCDYTIKQSMHAGLLEMASVMTRE